MTKQLGLMNVNETFKLGDVSEDLQRFILECGYDMTDHYVPTAQINSYTTRKLWNKDTMLGLRVYRDYYLCVDLVYPAYDRNTYYEGQENPIVGYVTQDIGRLHKTDSKGWKVVSSGIENNWNIIDWLEKNHIEVDKLFDEITQLMNGNFEVVEDYDAEAIDEALECGDIELAWDLLGDRDLVELM